MVARLSKKRETRQEKSPAVGFRFLANAPPQEALKLPGWSQSLTYEPMGCRGSFSAWVSPSRCQFELFRAIKAPSLYTPANLRACLAAIPSQAPINDRYLVRSYLGTERPSPIGHPHREKRHRHILTSNWLAEPRKQRTIHSGGSGTSAAYRSEAKCSQIGSAAQC